MWSAKVILEEASSVAEGVKRQPLMTWSCTEQAMFDLLKSRDAHSIGIGSVTRLRLLMSLLAWNPYERISAEKALAHQMFSEPS